MRQAIASTNEDSIRAKFDDDGYVVLPTVFNDDEIAVMQQEADFILDLIINSSLFHERQSRLLDIRRN